MKEYSLKRAFKATGWNLISNVTSILKGLVLSIFLARYLGVEDYGDYAFTISLITILVTICRFGVDSVSIKDISLIRDESKRKLYINSCIRIEMIGSLIAVMVLLVFSSRWRYFSSRYLLFLVIFLLVQVIDVFRCDLQAAYNNCVLSVARSAVYIIGIAVNLVCAYLKYGVEMFITIFVLTEVAVLLIPLIIEAGNKTLVRFIWGHHNDIKQCMSTIVRKSLPVWIGAISVSIYMKIDQVMIRTMLNNAELGIYSVVVRIAEAWYFLPTIVATSMLPYFANLYKDDKDAYWVKYETFANCMVGIGYLFAIIISVFGNQLILFIYGAEYAKAGDLIKLYVWGGIPVVMGLTRSIDIYIEERTLYTCLISIISAIANCIMNYILLPVMGIHGAALATIASYVLQSYILTFVFPKLWKVGTVLTKSILAPVNLLYALGSGRKK